MGAVAADLYVAADRIGVPGRGVEREEVGVPDRVDEGAGEWLLDRRLLRYQEAGTSPEPVMRVRAVGEPDAGRVERAEQDADVVARVPVVTSEHVEPVDPLRPQAGDRDARLRRETELRRVQLADGAEVEGVGEPRLRVVDVRSAADRDPRRELERERRVDVQ